MMDLVVFSEDHPTTGFVNWEPPENHVLLLVYGTMRDGAHWDDENVVATIAGPVLGKIEGVKHERFGCFSTMGLLRVKYPIRYVPKKTFKLL